MGKRLATLVAFVFAAALLAVPTTAQAMALADEIIVNGVDIVTAPNNYVQCGAGYASYDPFTGVLTLHDAEVTQKTGVSTTERSIEAGVDMDLDIVLEGHSTLNAALDVSSADGQAGGDITISGNGSLTITSEELGPTAIHAAKNIVIDGATVTIDAYNSGAMFASGGTLTIKGGAQVDVYAAGASNHAVLGTTGVIVSGEGTYFEAELAPNRAQEGFGSILSDAGLSVSDGAEVVATGYVVTQGDVLVQSGGSLAATDTAGYYGIYCLGTLTVDDASLTSQSPATGAVVLAGFSATGGGDVEVTGGVYPGLDCRGDVSVSGGEATFSSDDHYALYAAGTASLTGGTITMDGSPALSAAKIDLGSNAEWYQWATSDSGAVMAATVEPYDFDSPSDDYLRMEPAGGYVLTVEGGEGSGTYAAGEKVTISTESFDADGHFTAWSASDSTGTGVIADPSALETTFTMPAEDVTISAYEPHSLTHHDGKAPTCTEAGWEAYDECEECGYSTYEEIPATGHDFVDGTCTVCGAEGGDGARPMPAGDGEAIPATGEPAAVGMAACALAGVVVAGAGALSRRRGR